MLSRQKEVNFTLEQASKAQKGVKARFYSFFNLGASLGVSGQRQAPNAETDPVPIVQEAGWAPGPVWTGAENLAPHRDSIPGPSTPYRVAIPTGLSRPMNKYYIKKMEN
jgi:hypothetical protein